MRSSRAQLDATTTNTYNRYMIYVEQFHRLQSVLKFHPKHVQLFSQMYALEGNQMSQFMSDLNKHLRPKRLTVTIRYTDWWNWELNQPLRIESKWIQNLKIPDSLEEWAMEFETRNGKKAELDILVQNTISKWRFEVGQKPDGNGGDEAPSGKHYFLTLGNRQPVTSTWVGSAKVGGCKYRHHLQDVNGGDVGADEMLYYIVKMIWKKEKV